MKHAIKKYGVKNFTKDILHIFTSEVEMNEMEAELVDEAFVARDDTYNLCCGGRGGFGYINKELTESMYEVRRRNMLAIDINIKIQNGARMGSKNLKASHRAGKIRYDTFTGKKHSDETKCKMSKSHTGQNVGSKNSQYGTCWITKDTINKKIKKECLNIWLTEGWKCGRVL